MTTMRARIGKLTTGDLIGEPPAAVMSTNAKPDRWPRRLGRPNGTSRRSPRSSTSAGSGST